MKKCFDGMYYKHVNGGQTVSVIQGISSEHAFVQIITDINSYYFKYPLSVYKHGKGIIIGRNMFSDRGIKLHIENENISIHGKIKYLNLTPLKYDIMGPFKAFPMQCRHKIRSLHHRLDGFLEINGEHIDFTGGTGYIEGDCGRSFPKNYLWLQCNDFPEKTCITAGIADIPFLGFHFRGCICIVYYKGHEYRLATYLGVKILVCRENKIILEQGKLRLEIDIKAGAGSGLIAPRNGKMIRGIRECISCEARFKFWDGQKLLINRSGMNTSYENVKGEGNQ